MPRTQTCEIISARKMEGVVIYRQPTATVTSLSYAYQAYKAN